jgi:hypothetical protein
MRILTILLLLSAYPTFSQQTRQANWQQQVNYEIEVTLNETQRTLHGKIAIEYHNQSPDTLREIYIHLWPNAYANKQTAFAKQQIDQGKTLFLEAEEEMLGGIDSLDFSIRGRKLKWEYTQDIDIARITLPEPLTPGTKIIIETPFKVTLPGLVFSRMGTERSFFNVTQWYPKPAVYDVNGWNPMPYLDQGEFYSEFGKFDVKITVPTYMVVAATGVLQNEEEKDWWIRRSEDIRATYPYQSRTKTLHFIQDSIHDFAWFASGSFCISRGEVWRKNRTIETWLFAPDLDSSRRRAGVNYINNAIRFYSDKVGEYPYSHATVVITPLKAGGGMEYPTITNCTSIDETTIIHEIGHNWFYGILASNERSHPWMDESINTYYETRLRHPHKHVPKYKRFFKTMIDQKGAFELEDIFKPFHFSEWLYQIEASKGSDQQGCMHAAHFTSTNYGAVVYSKNAKAFYYLQNYLGEDVFDTMMQAYYNRWKFKHPLPADFKDHVLSFVKNTTGKDVSWFFDEVLCSDVKLDAKINGMKKNQDSVALKIGLNRQVPFSITGLMNDSVVFHQWYEPADTVVIPLNGATEFRVDGYEEMLDIYRNNNRIRTTGMFKKWNSFRPVLLMDISSPYENRMFITPIMGANMHNGYMLGAAMFNSTLPTKRTEYLFAPMYSFGTRDIAGYASLKHQLLPDGKIARWLIGVDVTRFASQNLFIDFRNNTVYERVAPYVEMQLKKSPNNLNLARTARVEYIMAHEQSFTSALFRNFGMHHAFLNLNYTAEHTHKLTPYYYSFSYQFGNSQSTFQKLSVEGSYFFNYGKPNKGLKVRGFAGTFLQSAGLAGNGTENFRVGNNTSSFDYTFSQAQFGRGALSPFDNNLFANQLLFGDAQFHVVGFSSSTDSWLLATNLRTTLPGIIPIYLYADVATINEKVISNTSSGAVVQYTPKLFYTGGVGIILFKEILQIHIPFVASDEIMQYWEFNSIKFQQRINFSLNLNKLAPIKNLQNLKLN